jgi:hypothetical protein
MSQFCRLSILVLLAALTVHLVAEDAPDAQTVVQFNSDFPVGLFRINSMIVEPSGKSMDASLSIVQKRMDLLTISPATLTLPNGDYILSIGVSDDFNRLVPLKATGTARTITVHGNQTASRVAGIATIVLGLVTFIFSPNLEPLFSQGTLNAPGIVALSSGGLTLVGSLAWGISSPWVEVK